ncbi:MAG: cytochrome c oxidase subunit 1 [bacterium]|nr:MAG: cytochrome c oxidase subunit 1 [bacterium]
MELIDRRKKEIKQITIIWMITTLVLFVILALLGFLMRLNQGNVIKLPADYFYSFMTLHGLGMVGVLFSGGLAALWYLLSKHIEMSIRLMKLVFGLVVTGVVGLIIATLIGRFGPGWYMLYPLPFKNNGIWASWSTGLASISIMFLGVGWLLAQLDVLRALAARYGLSNLLGWQHFRKNTEDDDMPPIALVGSVSCIAGSLATVAGALLLTLYIIQWLIPSMSYNALWMKNIVFLFGHTIVNITLYFGLGFIYELMPVFTGRPWKMNKIFVISWNTVLVFVLIAYFHHLYMDFAQPLALQYIGQIASYLSAVPATVITVFGIIAQVYRSKMDWTYTPLSFWLGVVGWVIGGFLAVVDSTILINVSFHNTLWVPGHFHTYFVMGFLLMLFGFIYHFLKPVTEKIAKISLIPMVIGGYGFLAMFAIGGLYGVPRRYASYSEIPLKSVAQSGETLAYIAALFVGLFLLGITIYYVSVFANIRKAWSQ